MSMFERLGDLLNEYLEEDPPQPLHENSKKDAILTKEVPQYLKVDFQILGIPCSSTYNECRKAYIELLKETHPDTRKLEDKNKNDSMKNNTDKIEKIINSWKRLKTWFTSANSSFK